MKKYLLFLIFSLLISCNNDDNSSANNRLEGKWSWIKTSGGFGGPGYPEASSQKIVIEISNTTIKTYANGTLIKDQKYFISTKESIFGGNKKMIVIDKGSSITQETYIDRSYEIKGKKLFLAEECLDCSTSEYDRIK